MSEDRARIADLEAAVLALADRVAVLERSLDLQRRFATAAEERSAALERRLSFVAERSAAGGRGPHAVLLARPVDFASRRRLQ